MKRKKSKENLFITESPVVVDDGSFGLAVTVEPLFPPFIDCVLILVFGESSAIITSVNCKNIGIKSKI